MRLMRHQSNQIMPQSSVSDIAFLLMIFFILTAAWSTPHILHSSSGNGILTVSAGQVSQIRITSSGIMLDGIYVEYDILSRQLDKHQKYRILADDDAEYQQLISVLDCLSRYGITHIQVAGDET